MFSQCFGILQVHKNEISLPKWSGGTHYSVLSPPGALVTKALPKQTSTPHSLKC